jgi:hypothetical protein
MRGHENRVNDTVQDSFSVSTSATTFLLSPAQSGTSRFQTIDILLGALVESFIRVFAPQRVPKFYTESHGRDADLTDLDLSRTVGWFTAIQQVSVGSLEATFQERCREIESSRQHSAGLVPEQFAAAIAGSKTLGTTPFQIMFNYAGAATLNRTAAASIKPSLLQPGVPDCSNDAPRFALLEVMARVVDGRLVFDIVHNRHMRGAENIKDWAQKYNNLLENFQHQKQVLKPKKPIRRNANEEDAHDELRDTLSEAEFENIEQLLPASAMQQAMLSTQVLHPNLYWVSQVFRITSKMAVSSSVLAQAWRTVVQHHSALRTVFCESDYFGDRVRYTQVVLLDASSRMEVIDCGASRQDFENMAPRSETSLHRVAVYQATSNELLMRLEIPHTIIDGTSTSILLEEIAHLCLGIVLPPKEAKFDPRQFLTWQLDGSEDDRVFWKERLTDIPPTLFPDLGDPSLRDRGETQHLTLRLPSLSKTLRQLGITSSTILQAAWALVLTTYTNMETVSFGVTSSLRDPSFDGIEDVVGPYITMIPLHVTMNAHKKASVREFLIAVSTPFLGCLEHQGLPLAEIFRVSSSRSVLFNTALSVQSREEVQTTRQGVTFEQIDGHDPSEVSDCTHCFMARFNL